MTHDPKGAAERAELRLEKAEKAQKAAREGEQAMAEYVAAARALDEKTLRLKSLRLAKEAADAADAKAQPKQEAKRPARKRVARRSTGIVRGGADPGTGQPRIR